MTKAKLGVKNSLYGKTHTEETKNLIRKSRIGKKFNLKTKKAISIAIGSSVYLYKSVSDTPKFSSTLRPKSTLCPEAFGDTDSFITFGSESFVLVNKYTSIRETARYKSPAPQAYKILNISKTTVSKYLKPASLFKGTYKF